MATIMQLSPRGAMRAGALLAVMVIAAIAVPGSSKVQVFPGACRTIDTMDADAWGEAVSLQILVGGDMVFSSAEVSAYQDGPGMNSSEAHEFQLAFPSADDPIVSATLLSERVDLKVDEDPLRSQAWSQATVLDLDVLNGTVTADVIKAWANAEADTHHAYTRTMDSEIVGLHVGDLADFQVAPGVQVNLGEVTDSVVGNGSFVQTYVRDDNSSFPGHGSILYKGDTTVTMLHIYLANVVGFGSVEILVSKAHAHAESPTPFCGLVQNVKAAAYVARVRPDIDSSTSLLVGEQHIGVVGGQGHQQLFGAEIPVGPSSVAEVNVTESEVYGNVTPNVESVSFAMSKVLGVCILQDGTVAPENATIEDYGDCLVGATAIRAESNSLANSTAAISWGSVTIVGLTVAGVDVCEALGMADENDVEGNNETSTNICKPPMNTKLEIGPFTVILNQRERDAAEPGHTGYFVRAVRIQGPIVGDVIVSRAYTSADYLDPGPTSAGGPLTGSAP